MSSKIFRKKIDEILVEEELRVKMTSDFTGITLNDPEGFYRPVLGTTDMCQCDKHYRYKGEKPFPLQYPCPACDKWLEHFGIYFTPDGETRDKQYIRKNIESEIEFLKTLYHSYKGYHPFMCEYAQYFYSIGDYFKAIEVGLDLRQRMIKSMGIEGTMPLDIVGKAHRALYRSFAQNGDYKVALYHIEELKQIKRETKTDLKNAEKYRSFLSAL
ncbi:MAG: hypothetical protein JXA54_10775 [Candidatus Heimdallarchaeota archaeon]|nr:hypothetical protein [Candidatus Heimdallarchaeota archaeon]